MSKKLFHPGKAKKKAAAKAEAEKSTDGSFKPVVKALLASDPNFLKRKSPFGSTPVGSVLGGYGTLGG